MSIAIQEGSQSQEYVHFRKSAIDDHPSIFTDIYKEDVNIAIWKRNISTEVNTCVKKLLNKNRNYAKSIVATPSQTCMQLIEADNDLQNAKALIQDISELVDMFCLLHELKKVGLRITVLDQAMCPRFHVDRVPCRLVCTYYGVASEWIPYDKVNRSKLGRGNNELSDEESGLYESARDIHQLKIGDVAMLKGELWEGNENAGLVHRSPQVSEGDKRLLLTLDYLD